MTTLKYGRDSSVALDLSQTMLIGDKASGPGEPLADVTREVTQAFSQPLDLPPLAQMILPDDNIVVALEPGLPAAAKILAGVVTAIADAGVALERLMILRTKDDRGVPNHRLLQRIPPALRNRLQLAVHDPEERTSLSYLAASSADEPIYINRHLCDADFLLPIGTLEPTRTLAYWGVHQSWFPTFADSETRERFQKPQSALSAKQRESRRQECAEATWLVGALSTLQVVSAGGERLLRVLFGTPDAVAREGRKVCDQAWHFSVPRRASLVVAAIEGGPEQQTWRNVARCLSSALAAVEDDGAIAICTELREKLGPALRRLARAESWEDADRAVKKQKSRDALVATQLLRALRRVRVYLLSELEEDVVEQLGLAYVACAEEISRLSAKHDSCLVLGNAQHARVAVKEA